MAGFRRAPQLLIRTVLRVSTPHRRHVPDPFRTIRMEQPDGRSPLAIALTGHATLVVEHLSSGSG